MRHDFDPSPFEQVQGHWKEKKYYFVQSIHFLGCAIIITQSQNEQIQGQWKKVQTIPFFWKNIGSSYFTQSCRSSKGVSMFGPKATGRKLRKLCAGYFKCFFFMEEHWNFLLYIKLANDPSVRHDFNQRSFDQV